jgi:hypothetical protein
MPRFTEYILFNASALAAATPGTAFANSARGNPPQIEIVVVVTGAVGTGLVFSLFAGMDSTNMALVGATTPTITAAGTYRFIFPANVYEPMIRLDASTVTGSYASVTVYLLASGAEEN